MSLALRILSPNALMSILLNNIYRVIFFKLIFINVFFYRIYICHGNFVLRVVTFHDKIEQKTDTILLSLLL